MDDIHGSYPWIISMDDIHGRFLFMISMGYPRGVGVLWSLGTGGPGVLEPGVMFFHIVECTSDVSGFTQTESTRATLCTGTEVLTLQGVQILGAPRHSCGLPTTKNFRPPEYLDFQKAGSLH